MFTFMLDHPHIVVAFVAMLAIAAAITIGVAISGWTVDNDMMKESESRRSLQALHDIHDDIHNNRSQ